jgi:hypothetical protein
MQTHPSHGVMHRTGANHLVPDDFHNVMYTHVQLWKLSSLVALRSAHDHRPSGRLHVVRIPERTCNMVYSTVHTSQPCSRSAVVVLRHGHAEHWTQPQRLA